MWALLVCVFLFCLTFVGWMDRWIAPSKNPTCLLHNSCLVSVVGTLLALPFDLRKRVCFLMCLLHKGGNRSGLLTKSLVYFPNTSRIRAVPSASVQLNIPNSVTLMVSASVVFLLIRLCLVNNFDLDVSKPPMPALSQSPFFYKSSLSVLPTWSCSLQTNPAWHTDLNYGVPFCPWQLNNFDFTAVEKVAEWVVY